MDPTILIFIAIVLVFMTVSTYNRFIKYRNRIEETWSGIDIALKRRANLIPAMVDSIKMYNSHEAETLMKTVEARQESVSGNRSETESAISQSLQGAIALAEAYPDLKANSGFMALQKSLAEVEQEILQARQVFNTAVRNNNTLVQSFPSNILATIFRFRTAQYFSLELATERAVPEIK